MKFSEELLSEELLSEELLSEELLSVDEFSEEEWGQLEEAASCAQVVKVEVTVLGLGHVSDGKGCTVLAAGLVRNKVLKEVEFTGVPEDVEETVREILKSNTELTVVVR